MREGTIPDERRQRIVSEAVGELLITHLTDYLYSSNLYRNAGMWAKSKGLTGVAYYLFTQHQERQHSAKKLHKFLDAAGVAFVIPEINTADKVLEVTTLKELFQTALDNEIDITDSLTETAKTCLEDAQHLAYHFVSKALFFQLGEEDEARDRINFTDAADSDLLVDATVRKLMDDKKAKKAKKK